MPSRAVQDRAPSVRPPLGAGLQPLEACVRCPVRGRCLLADLPTSDLRQLDTLIRARKPVPPTQVLYYAGQAAGAIYAVRSGVIKTTVNAENGRPEQITGFHMGGDVVGIEGIASGKYASTAVALDEATVCVMPLPVLEGLASKVPGLQRRLLQTMSCTLSRNARVLLLLGSLRAEERLAAFLLQLSRRAGVLGSSETQVHLCMSRAEIASHLGLKLETISRTFSRLHQLGLIRREGRRVSLLNVAALEKIGVLH